MVDWSIGNSIVFFVFLGAMLLVVYQIQHSNRTLKLYIGLVLLGLLLQALSYLPSTSLNFNRFFEVFSTLMLLAFLGLSIYLILRELAITEQVTADIIKGGICVYFLLGFFWTSIYETIYSFDANSF
ncbi:MAG TPA: hypothetical protein V6C57_01275, partial [Coleofasciculaceae cyanobacterium]